jgi:hypothetical protein
VHNAGGAVTLRGTTAQGNQAGSLGGALSASGGTTAVESSTLEGNSAGLGGAVATNSGGSATILDSTLEGNQASSDGGAVFATNGSRVTVGRSLLAGNYAGVAGGALELGSSARVTITESTLTGNEAGRFGGAVLNFRGTLDIVNSTLSGNTAGENAGAVGNPGGTTTITASTITANAAAGNTGGVGNAADHDGTLALHGTIVAGNTAAASPDVSGALVSGGYNLIGDGTGATGLGAEGDQVGTADAPIDPRLGPLADNGGPTPTHALLPGSRAVDAGGPAPDGLTTDQRGLPRVVRGAMDVGAVEVQNQEPRVTDFTASGAEDAPLAFSRADFEAAFLDPDSELAVVRVIDLPANGTLTLNGVAVAAGQEIAASDLDGLAFHPDADSFGAVTFRYAAADEYGYAADPAAVTLDVAPVNDAPAAAADSYRVFGGTTLTVDAAGGVLANDADVEGDALTAVLVSGPANGTLTLNADGSFTYTPAKGFVGTDTFRYAPGDGRALGEPVLVTVTVERKVLAIDVGPGDPGNTIDLRRDSKVAVAVLSTAEFDATRDLNIESLTFGKTGAEDSLVRHRKHGRPEYRFEDVNGDGRLDLVAYFDVSLTGLAEGDSSATLRGELLDGTLIEAVDVVNVTVSTKPGPGKKK